MMDGVVVDSTNCPLTLYIPYVIQLVATSNTACQRHTYMPNYTRAVMYYTAITAIQFVGFYQHGTSHMETAAGTDVGHSSLIHSHDTLEVHKVLCTLTPLYGFRQSGLCAHGMIVI